MRHPTDLPSAVTRAVALGLAAFLPLSAARAAEPPPAPYQITELAPDGAWTWFNDERTVYDGDGFYIGSIDSQGRSRVDYFALPDAPLPSTRSPYPLSTWLSLDDHNNPALLLLDNGKLLAAYAEHHLQPQWHTRVGERLGPPEARFVDWSDEATHPAPARVTYNNLVQLSDEDGRIYNFMRCIGWNPTLLLSNDNGSTWSDPIELIRSGNDRTRPYVKYADNGRDRIDLIFTDAHPRNDPLNNVYHLYYRNGYFHRSDGSRIRSLASVMEEPLLPSDATRIYAAEEAGRGWVWDLEYDANGNPVAAFINAVDHEIGNDLRYRIARWNPESQSWSQSQIAYAGTHLYDREEHYAGGIAIDPSNTDRVFFSADVDPSTGAPNASGRYQIFEARRAPEVDRWTFQQLTFDTDADNIRPIVPRHHDLNTVAIWLNGRYTTYLDYQTRVVGILEK